MKRLLNIGIVVTVVLLFTCLCWKTEKCNINETPVYAQDELHIPGIYLSKYLRNSISTTEPDEQLKNTNFLSNTIEAINDSTKQTDILNIHGIHIPAYLRKQIAQK